MTLWNTGVLRLWEWAALALRQAWQSFCKQADEPYLLRPRCCRAGSFRELP
jgi:hypothetical protein